MDVNSLTQTKQLENHLFIPEKPPNFYFFFWVLLPVYLLIFSNPQAALSKPTESPKNIRVSSHPKFLLDPANRPLPESKQLEQIAKSITVKVLSGKTWGSGFLLQKQGQSYTVVTNRHVLSPSDPPYLVQTPDGRTYEAYLPTSQLRFDGNDLAVLEFRSTDRNYTVASLRSSNTLTEGDKVFAAGFPFNARGLIFTKGQISLLSNKALEQGYQIGYTNEIQKGMSGGPLLNCQGEVVGINGMHAYPLWGDPYVYQDGSLPSVKVRDRMVALAFAIPIETFAHLAPQLASLPENIQRSRWNLANRSFPSPLDWFSFKPPQSSIRPKSVSLDSVYME